MEANLIMVLYSLKNIQAFPIVRKIMTRIFKVSYKTMHDLPHLVVPCPLLTKASDVEWRDGFEPGCAAGCGERVT